MSKQKAFTLIEILIVIVVISILAGFLSIQINNSINTGKDAKRKSDIELLGNAIISYSADHYSRLPVNDIGCTIDVNCSTEINEAFKATLPTLPIDPDSGTSYSYKTINNGLDCEINALLSTGKTYTYSCGTETASENLPVTAVCGDLVRDDTNGYAAINTDWPPAGTFCNPETTTPPIFPATQGTFVTWTCFGKYLGSNATCTAYRALDGECGTADFNKHVFADAETPFGAYTLCDTGTPDSSPVPPPKGTSISWICNGLYGGASPSCTAKHSANGVCGSVANGKTYAYNASGYSPDVQCNYGTASSTAFPLPGGSTTWTCLGINGGDPSANCTASRAAAPVICNSVHTINNCIADGGTPYNLGSCYICRFSMPWGQDMDANYPNCPSGWTQYENWTTTLDRVDVIPGLGYPLVGYCGTRDHGATAGMMIPYTAGYHPWSNHEVEHMHWDNGHGGVNWTCWQSSGDIYCDRSFIGQYYMNNPTHDCHAYVTERGCY